jgi:hypothetical protein
MGSGICYFTWDGHLTDRQFQQHFYRIDTRLMSIVTWDALISHLIKEIASTELRVDNQSVHFVQKTGTVQAERGVTHRDMVHRIGLLESKKEYVTMSRDSICF